ncbi:MAG TPA: HDOD domain-containing protein [Polyangia bacterium]|jgi:putative nucleotidyltransferase with HDIG domain|nr:HDOD domain-containing protein [Polyangia bacterium]
MQLSMIFHRQHTRHNLVLEAEVSCEGRLIQGRTMNISKGGCSVLSRTPLTVGCEHSVRLKIDGLGGKLPSAVDLSAMVVWCTRSDRDFQIGLKFFSQSNDTVKLLETILALASAQAPANDRDEPAAAPAPAPNPDPFAYALEDLAAVDGFTVSHSQEDLDQVDRLAVMVVDHFWQNRPDPLAFPHLATQMIDALEDPEVELTKIVGLVQQEPAIAASLMKAANSPLFRRGMPVLNLNSAVTKLGLRTVGHLAAGVASTALFDMAARTELALHAGRWHSIFHHALTTAFSSAWLAERCRVWLPDRAFSAGLLHDVGKSLALRSLSALQIDGKVDTQVPDQVVEMVLEKTHLELGVEMHVAWSLPEYLLTACRQHHDENLADSAETRVLHVVRVASGLNELRTMPSLAAVRAPALCQSLRTLGLERTGLTVIREQLDHFAQKVEGIIG